MLLKKQKMRRMLIRSWLPATAAAAIRCSSNSAFQFKGLFYDGRANTSNQLKVAVNLMTIREWYINRISFIVADK